jgi:hypothetical protein
MRAPQNRWQAFLVHLGLSTVIFLVLLYLIVFHWYPQPYFATDGGWQGVRLITGVDLVLGPLLTLIVYKLGKPRLRLDLTLIGLVQTVALVWGTWLVHGERIALVSYANDAFYTLTGEQVRSIGGKAQDIAAQSDRIPPYSFVRLPGDPKERRTLLLGAALHGVLPYQFADRHEPYGPEHLPEVFARGIDPGRLAHDMPAFKDVLEAFLKHHGGNERDYVYVPARGRYDQQLLVLRRQDGKIVGSIEQPQAESADAAPATTAETKP